MADTKTEVKTVPATIKAVADFFGRKPNQTLKEWSEEWKQLSETDKEQIKLGIGNGTLSY